MADVSPSRERMQRMRADIVADMRTTTAADPRGNRKMLIGALSVLAPDHPLLRKLIRCGQRNQWNDSRTFCEHPACAVCMWRRGRLLFRKRLWPALEDVHESQLRWVTVLMFERASLDDGAREMDRQYRRLQYFVKKFVGKNRTRIRIWGAREVEPTDAGWTFHVHMVVDLADADPGDLAKILRSVWGGGSREVQVKTIDQFSHRANISRLSRYMTKARYTQSVGDGTKREWLSNEDMVMLAMWRDRQPAQWHRFTIGVRGWRP